MPATSRWLGHEFELADYRRPDLLKQRSDVDAAASAFLDQQGRQRRSAHRLRDLFIRCCVTDGFLPQHDHGPYMQKWIPLCQKPLDSRAAADVVLPLRSKLSLKQTSSERH